MAGYCTHCGGTGYRKPSKDKADRETRALVQELATLVEVDLSFQAEEGADALNDFIRRARRIIKGQK